MVIGDGPSDVGPLRAKSIAWHWELMFTMPQYRTVDLVQQHHLLNHVADLDEGGRLRPTSTTTLSPINPDNLRDAHRRIETGRTTGKIVLHGWP